MLEIAAFRHDPIRSSSRLSKDAPVVPDWQREPVVCGYRKLVCQSPRTQQEVPVPVSATPIAIAGVGAIIASDDGFVRFHDVHLKKTFWERRLNASIYAAPFLDRSRDRAIVASTRGLATCFDLRGKTLWASDLGNPAYANPVLLKDGRTLVFSLFNSRCIGLDIETGARLFEVGLPQPWHASVGSVAGYRDPYASPVPLENGSVIVCCAEDALCLSPEGKTLWLCQLGHSVKASPVAIRSTEEVFLCLVNGDALFLDAGDGSRRTLLSLGSKIIASPAISGDTIAVGLQGDESVGVSVTRRHTVWRTHQGAPRSYTSFTTLPNGAFICTNGRGNVVAYEASTGEFLWESSQVLGLPNHETPMDITPVSDGAGNLYCASYEGDVYSFQFPIMEQGRTQAQ